jgi:hypothetical protein
MLGILESDFHFHLPVKQAPGGHQERRNRWGKCRVEQLFDVVIEREQQWKTRSSS